jgi:hypothetical protein
MLFLGERYRREGAGGDRRGVEGRAGRGLRAEAQAVAERNWPACRRLSVRAMKRVLNQVARRTSARRSQLETDATVAGFLDPETTRRMTAF